MLTTPELREAWAPACDVPLAIVELVQGVRIQCHRDVATAVKALGRVFEAHDYAVRQGDTGAYNCRRITAGKGHSLHSFGIAVDVNWNSNPFRKDNVLVTDMPQVMVRNVLRIRTVNDTQVWGWGGNYRTVKDAMHYEVVCAPADLATGIDWDTVEQPKLREGQPHRWPLLARGDRGPAVEKLHDLLGIASPGDAGYGLFGPKTEVAVRTYQRNHGLDVDGRVGRQTWTALLTDQPDVPLGEPGPVKRQPTGASPEPPLPRAAAERGEAAGGSVFRGRIQPGDIRAELDSDASNGDDDLLVAMYSPRAGGDVAVDESVAAPGGAASVVVTAGGRGVLEVWVAIGAAGDRGTLRVFAGGRLQDEAGIDGSVRWIYSVQASG